MFVLLVCIVPLAFSFLAGVLFHSFSALLARRIPSNGLLVRSCVDRRVNPANHAISSNNSLANRTAGIPQAAREH